MPAHNDTTRRVLASLTEPKSAGQVAQEIGATTVTVLNLLEWLATRRFVERTGETGPRVHRFGRPPALWRKLSDHETEARQRFEAARKVVETAGFVLVPRRGL